MLRFIQFSILLASLCNCFCQEFFVDKLPFVRLELLNRNPSLQQRVFNNQVSKMDVRFEKGEPYTYKLTINHNEVNEKIFNLTLFVSASYIDLNDAVKSFKLYNELYFVLLHNVNGFFPAEKNEYFLLNESKLKSYKLEVSEIIKPLVEDKELYKERLKPLFCPVLPKGLTLPYSFCD